MTNYYVECTDRSSMITSTYFIVKVNGGFQIETSDNEVISIVLPKKDLLVVLRRLFDVVVCHRL